MDCLIPTPGESGAWLTPDPTVKLRARARSPPLAARPPNSSPFSDGASPRIPYGRSAGGLSAPLRLCETRTCASWRVIEEATPKAGVPCLRHARGFQTQARYNARPASAEWGTRGPRVAIAWGSGRSPVYGRQRSAGKAQGGNIRTACDRRSNAARRTPHQENLADGDA